MEKQPNVLSRMLRGRLFGFFVMCVVMGIALGLAPNSAQAQTTPEAGTSIENQASATYVDNNGATQTVTSNKVTTTVQQVPALTLTQGTVKTTNPGGQVVFPHTVTNNGNGADSFALSYTDNGGDFNFTSVTIYADTDGNGVADNNTPITQTTSVDIGDSYSFVVVAEVPTSPTASNGNSATLDVTATSNFDGTTSASTANTQSNQANVTEDASVDVLKSQSANSGTPGSTVTMTLTFTNNGNTDAANLELVDPIQPGFDYDLGTARWSGSGTTPLGDNAGNGDDPSGITFEYDASGNGGNGQITATIASLASGQQGTLTFDVEVESDTEGQTIQNTANYNYANNDAPNTPIFGTNPSTNTTNYTVEDTYGVVYVDDDGTDDGIRSKGPVTQGATVNFSNKFQNTGSTTDRFDITLANGNYPSGTTFTLYRGDGNGNTNGLLGNSGGTGAPDIQIAPGATAEVILQVQLPAGASGDNGGSGFSIQKTATSIGDNTESATLNDQLTEITANEVDVTNDSAYNESTPAPGQGVEPTGEATAVTTNSTNPGTTTNFTLYLNNRSSQSDNYNLAASTDPNNFGAGLPAGYSVTFRKGGPTGAVVTNSGTVNANASQQITAIVSVPSNAAAGTVDIYFRAQSTTSGATDVKHDAVTVNQVRSLSLVATQNGQIAPGGSVVYPHTLTNTGNTNENDGTNSTLQLEVGPNPGSFGTVVVYIDEDGSGTINAGDTQVATGTTGSPVSIGSSGGIDVGTLAPGAVVNLLVKVTANAGVTDGTTYTSTVTVSDDGTSGGSLASVDVSDITTVVLGNLVITKKQRKQGESSYVSTNINANPGDIIEYQITVTNQGSAEVTDIEVTDSTPSFTTLSTAATVTGSATVDSQPTVGSAGTIVVELASLGGGSSFTINFAVQIDG